VLVCCCFLLFFVVFCCFLLFFVVFCCEGLQSKLRAGHSRPIAWFVLCCVGCWVLGVVCVLCVLCVCCVCVVCVFCALYVLYAANCCVVLPDHAKELGQTLQPNLRSNQGNKLKMSQKQNTPATELALPQLVASMFAPLFSFFFF